MEGVDRDTPDAEILVEVLVRRNVAPAALDAHFHMELATLGHGRDVSVRLENLDVGVALNIASSDFASLVDPQRQCLGVVDMQFQRNLLEIENDVGGVLDDTR